MTNREKSINQVLTTSGHTTNYDLPLWEGQDVTSWLTTMNDAMDKIDTAIYDREVEIVNINKDVQAALDNANEASEKAEEAVIEMPNVIKGLADTNTIVDAHGKRLTSAEKAIEGCHTEIQSNTASIAQLQTDVGTIENKLTCKTYKPENELLYAKNLKLVSIRFFPYEALLVIRPQSDFTVAETITILPSNESRVYIKQCFDEMYGVDRYDTIGTSGISVTYGQTEFFTVSPMFTTLEINTLYHDVPITTGFPILLRNMVYRE